MSLDDRLDSGELPLRLRGYDREATDELLQAAETALSDVVAERDALRSRVAELERALAELEQKQRLRPQPTAGRARLRHERGWLQRIGQATRSSTGDPEQHQAGEAGAEQKPGSGTASRSDRRGMTIPAAKTVPEHALLPASVPARSNPSHN